MEEIYGEKENFFDNFFKDDIKELLVIKEINNNEENNDNYKDDDLIEMFEEMNITKINYVNNVKYKNYE